ncbi:preprotein translocase subunit SecB [Oceanicola sp. 22II-s10i]|uniref:protein-export chaperone SecB n=1 Tax=Oceanicola sp. 22II-s10i TaxID=1317116 RepID=UPI000B5276D8|nr:protein-export chaperone SecB [Oceanicola sp. 22II-s10i]OWU85976.1 preprotein translocase subunit SecB [Oceanicola sp. 22II-s10i]
MTDTPAAPTEQPQLKFSVLNQFVRDMSFENIAARKQQNGEYTPDVQVQVGLDAKKRDADNMYEVATKLNIVSKIKDTDDTIFVLEIDYVGLFRIEGVPNDQLQPFLLIECPRQTFPFLRRIVSDVTRDGGFPPLNLDNIDFLQIFRQEVARRQATAQPNGAQA